MVVPSKESTIANFLSLKGIRLTDCKLVNTGIPSRKNNNFGAISVAAFS